MPSTNHGLHKTNFASLYLSYVDGFDMANGFNRRPANMTTTISVDGTTCKIVESRNEPENQDPLYDRFFKDFDDGSKPFELEDLHYDLHNSLKIDFAIHRTITALKNSELE